LKDAGYATYVAGKWQFDGGDTAIHTFGFDRYIVWNPFKDEEKSGLIYKNADLYSNGSYISKSITANTYDNDMYTDSVLYFIKENRQKKFFVYLPFTLCHAPYSPTPDDPEYESWISGRKDEGDPAFFPSMVKYTDKKIGQITDSLKAWNLYDNTIVIFAGDNGTPHRIFYYYNGQYIEGSKDETTEAGTRVPLIVTWPRGITAGQVNDNLVDFSDFLPTLGEAINVQVPASYGTIDGLSFYKQLRGADTKTRQWIYCQLEQKKTGQTPRWIQNKTYKLYDNGGKFVNIIADPEEINPLVNLTAAEQKLKTEFQSKLDSLH